MSSSSLVSFQIKSNDIPLKEVQVYSIEIHLYDNEEAEALVRLLPHSTSGFPEMDMKELELGQLFEISLGYDGNNKSVFSGKISSQELLVTHDDGAEMSIVCEDKTKTESGDSGYTFTYGDDILDMELVNSGSGITGSIRVQGVSVVPGQTFKLRGASNVFNGNHTITSVVHDVAQGNWWTELHIGAWPLNG